MSEPSLNTECLIPKLKADSITDFATESFTAIYIKT